VTSNIFVIKVTGAKNVTRAAWSHFRKQKYGRVVFSEFGVFHGEREAWSTLFLGEPEPIQHNLGDLEWTEGPTELPDGSIIFSSTTTNQLSNIPECSVMTSFIEI